jgi:hypothetical protein
MQRQERARDGCVGVRRSPRDGQVPLGHEVGPGQVGVLIRIAERRGERGEEQGGGTTQDDEGPRGSRALPRPRVGLFLCACRLGSHSGRVSTRASG